MHARSVNLFGILISGLGLLMTLTGCQTPRFEERAEQQAAANSDEIVLREGDVLKISFPGAPTLNTSVQIRRDGRISLPTVGEYKAAGLTPNALETALVKLYENQLQAKEVRVSVESSSFAVYVTGAVLRPGKVTSDRPITALEAIMEAGGFDYTKANLKKVRVIRHENGRTEHFTLNLKRVLNAQDSDQFNLKPGDIVYVPERFSWF